MTGTFTYVILTVLLVQNCLQEGGTKGIEYFIVPRNIEHLMDASVNFAFIPYHSGSKGTYIILDYII